MRQSLELRTLSLKIDRLTRAIEALIYAQRDNLTPAEIEPIAETLRVASWVSTDSKRLR
jgi:hypothetical protein